MVDVPDSMACLYSATIERRGESYLVEIPRSEIEHETVDPSETYRVALFSQPDGSETDTDGETGTELEASDRSPGPPSPPVDEGDVREVTIETLGEQGDGIAKIDRGFVVIVPGTSPGEQPTVEIEEVKRNVAFARRCDPRSTTT